MDKCICWDLGATTIKDLIDSEKIVGAQLLL
jgi:hypothetical protein